MTLLLSEVEVLVVDCQATGAHPRGRLLEVGWARTRGGHGACSPLVAESRLVRSVGWKEIPRRVRRVTGITPEELESASPAAAVWRTLAETARDVARTNRRSLCASVIHFSRFEEPHLRELHRSHAPGEPFPLETVCTHAMASRLLPRLPRKGLRAVAGSLGHSAPVLRRCAPHVAATAFIWRKLLRLLARDHGVETLEDLRLWLAEAPAAPRGLTGYPMDSRHRLALPHRPGVYRMLRPNGDVLYVGKARSLNRRVNSYFQKRRGHAEHTLEMLAQAHRVEVTVTGSALEAALLEPDEIKRRRPPYNLALQHRDRELAFCSKDLRRVRAAPDELHPMGPLPSAESLEPLAAFARLLEDSAPRTGTPEVCRSILGVPRRHAPPPECFARGIALFRSRHAPWLERATIPSALVGLGARLWRQRRQEPPPPAAEVSLERPAASPREWTPDIVADGLQETVERGSRLVRRARWLCALCESSLVWEEAPGGEAPRMVCLVFEAGFPGPRQELSPGAAPPLPPGHGRSLRARQRGFDLATYDRLSVLTQELRRLVRDGTRLELRLGPGPAWGLPELTRALGWV
jgi:DNA polymerase III epsilon subunit-like protein